VPSRDTSTHRTLQAPPNIDRPSLWRFRARYRGVAYDLKTERTVLGRSASCDIVLDDPLVSRRHAILATRGEAVWVEDHGSVNGVFVNGDRITAPRELSPGDRVVIGRQNLAIEAVSSSTRDTVRTVDDLDGSGQATSESLEGSSPNASEADSEAEATRTGDAFELLGGVADKVLALGRGQEAERILGSYLNALRERAQRDGTLDGGLASRAADYAVRLAAATGKGEWVDYTVELYSVLGRPLPGDVVDQLYSVLRRVSRVDVRGLRVYIAALRGRQDEFGPAERFVSQRIEGLESIAALR
jgi:hypothetical protein